MGSRQPLGPNADRGLIMHVSESWGGRKVQRKGQFGEFQVQTGSEEEEQPSAQTTPLWAMALGS